MKRRTLPTMGSSMHRHHGGAYSAHCSLTHTPALVSFVVHTVSHTWKFVLSVCPEGAVRVSGACNIAGEMDYHRLRLSWGIRHMKGCALYFFPLTYEQDSLLGSNFELVFKDLPHPCEESTAHRETVYSNMLLQINTLPFCLELLDWGGEMPARISFCRSIGMPETEAAKNNTVGFNETLSGLWLQGQCKPFEAAGEHCNKPWYLAFHFSCHYVSWKCWEQNPSLSTW